MKCYLKNEINFENNLIFLDFYFLIMARSKTKPMKYTRPSFKNRINEVESFKRKIENKRKQLYLEYKKEFLGENFIIYNSLLIDKDLNKYS